MGLYLARADRKGSLPMGTSIGRNWLSVLVDLQSRRAEQLQIAIRVRSRRLQAKPFGQREVVAIHARHKKACASAIPY
ncbi:hypothetical protein ACVOMV_33895 [Mesorhizobium atlanticum]